ncbi:hypothetical protein E6P78_10980 [Streptomyces sp. A0958]|nr:hypothetical protein E6P78_10980 [Streptomyces sp. A0958]
MSFDTRAPEELLHHLPALVLRRRSVSADPTGMLSGVRGSRLLDRRPPHYRCPAVPGLKTSARAILMAPGSSVLSSVINCVLLALRYCSRRPLSTAGHPVRSPVPSPSCNNPGFETPLPHRPANCNCGTAARQFVSARPC